MKHLAELFRCLIMVMKAYSLDALMPRFRDKSKCLDNFFFLIKMSSHYALYGHCLLWP